MKKYLVFVFVVLMASCTNFEEISFEQVEKQNSIVYQNKRSYEEALLIAQQSVDLFVSSETRAIAARRKINLNDTKFILSEVATRSGNQDTLMYVFNFEENQGFAIISANKATEPLLALTEQGTYNETTETENPAFGMFMDMAESYLTSYTSPILPDIEESSNLGDLMQFKRVYDTTEVVRIIPKVNTRWGQSGCEATYTSNGYSGCSNTAMAQIMSYFSHPSQIAITYPGASISYLNLDWNSIKSHNISHNIQSCTASDATHDIIGHLLRELGHLNASYYDPNGGTGTNDLNVRSTFIDLGYIVSDYSSYGNASLYSHLSGNELCFMSGYRIKEIEVDGDTIWGGHAWIVDGYLKHEIVVSDWEKKMSELIWIIVEEYDPYYTEYYHMNWGWDGSCNGFFQANVFNTDRAWQYDNLTGGFNNNANRDYQYRVRYFSATK